MNPAKRECSCSRSDQFQKSTANRDESECSCCGYVDCAADGDSESSAPTLTKRAAELTRLDVHPQAKHPRSEGSQMDVRSMTMAGVAVSGLEDENFDGHEDVGDLLDRLVDNTETEEATKAMLT